MVKLLPRDADVEVKFNEIGVQKLSAIRKDFDGTFGNFDTLHLIYCRHLQTFDNDPSSSEIEIIFLWDFRKDCTSFIVPMDFQNSHFSFLVVAFQFARRESRRKLPQPFELAAVKNNQARWQFYYIITMVANTINGEKEDLPDLKRILSFSITWISISSIKGRLSS